MSTLLPRPEDVESKARQAVEDAYREKLERLGREYEKHKKELEEKYKALPREFAAKLKA